MNRLHRFAWCAAVSALSLSAQAASTWDGGSASTSNWSDAANWSNDTAPASDAATDIELTGSVRRDPYLDSAFTLKTLVFTTDAGAFTLDGSTLSVAGVNNGTIAIHNQSTRSQTIKAPIQLLGSALFRAQNGDLHFNAIDLNNKALVFQADATETIYLDGVISDSQSGTSGLVEFTGPGTFVLSKTNTFTERPRIREGTVVVQSNGAFGTGSALLLGQTNRTNATVKLLTDGAVTVNHAINVNWVSGDSYTIGGMSADISTYSQTIQITNDSHDITLNLTAAAGGRVNFTKNLANGSTGNGNIVKLGGGIVALSNNSNDYIGTTEVSEGTLLFNGVLTGTGGAVTVKSGATLGGSGTINRAVNIQGGGILSAGNADAAGASLGGLLTVNGSLALNDTSAVVFDLGSAGSGGNDKVAISGDFTLDGLLQVNALSGFGAGTYTLFSYSGGAFADHGLTFGTMPAGFDYTLDTAGVAGQVNLIVAAVPEPGTLSFLMGGVFVLAGWSRYRGRAA